MAAWLLIEAIMGPLIHSNVCVVIFISEDTELPTRYDIIISSSISPAYLIVNHVMQNKS